MGEWGKKCWYTESLFTCQPFNLQLRSSIMMRPAKIVWYACLLIALWAGAISAEETAPVLTLDKAVSLALEKSPMLNSAKLGVNEAGHRQEAARADFFPKLSTDYSYTKLDEPPEMRFVSTQSTPLQSLVMGNKVEVGPGSAL